MDESAILTRTRSYVLDTFLYMRPGFTLGDHDRLLQRGVIIYQGFRNPMETLYVVGLLYFGVNFILEQASLATQRGGPAPQQ